MKRFIFLAALAAAAAACRARPPQAYVDPANPFLQSTVEQFRFASREAMRNKDVSTLANQVFLLKRALPVAWVCVADSSGTVLMHTDPRQIAAQPDDDLSRESLGYADPLRPLVRWVWSDDHRPVLDLTLPVMSGDGEQAVRIGYLRLGFYAGERTANWIPVTRGVGRAP
jgi:hypothetical protein